MLGPIGKPMSRPLGCPSSRMYASQLNQLVIYPIEENCCTPVSSFFFEDAKNVQRLPRPFTTTFITGTGWIALTLFQCLKATQVKATPVCDVRSGVLFTCAKNVDEVGFEPTTSCNGAHNFDVMNMRSKRATTVPSARCSSTSW